MKITNLLAKKPEDIIRIQSSQTLKEALEVMNQRRIGALMVEKDGKIVGIMTERDILRNIHKLQCFKDNMIVADIMTPKGTFIEGDASSDLQTVMQTMTDKKVRHLPIFDGGKMVGLVSIGDVIKSLLEAANDENQLLKGYIAGTY